MSTPSPNTNFYKIGPSHSVAYTATHGRVQAGTTAYVVEVYATTDCFIAFGNSSVLATTSSKPHPAGALLTYQIVPGQYISAVQMSSGGTVYATELID